MEKTVSAEDATAGLAAENGGQPGDMVQNCEVYGLVYAQIIKK